MSDSKSEQRVNIKFLVKLKTSATETFKLLTEAYGEDCMCRARVFEWHKRFSEGRESVHDNVRPGRPRTAVTDDNIEKVRGIIENDRRLGVRAVAELVNLDRESVRRILTEELNMTKICAKMVPKQLPNELKECRKKWCSDLLHRIDDKSDLLNSVISCDVVTCEQQWNISTPNINASSPEPKKARLSSSKFKATLVVFFDVYGIVMAEWVPSGVVVNAQYYVQVLTALLERLKLKRPEMWKNGWILHEDNAPIHTALPVKQLLDNENVTVLEHPLYSPDLAPCDFYLYPKIQSALKGTSFLSVDDVKSKTMELLNILTENDLRNCFEQWQHRMQMCVTLEGNYFDNEHS